MAPYGGPIQSLLLGMTMVLRAMNPRLLLLFFLLVPAYTYRIPKRSEQSVDDADEIYYKNGNIRCLRCPPGTFVLKQCTTPDTPSICAPCIPGRTYSEHLTGLNECLPCTLCRSDQEEVSACTITKNAICRCKEGTYCSPEEPCEICRKCTTSCPPNQVIKTPCNSTSDAQCAPPENEPLETHQIILLTLLIFMSVVGAAFFCFVRCADSRWSTKISAICNKTPEEDTETPFLPRGSKLYLRENLSENDKNEAIASTFHNFVDKIPTRSFERFVRELGLTNNEIDWAKQDNTGNIFEQHNRMLERLHQDKKFDVNVWLNKLHDMRMGEAAEKITSELLKKGWFERSTKE
ncbi:hypothetical protein GDO78_004898 [Eleutherodactylus coqui]|uniref:Uncharacterized protein n=1 Tax=Eleutherodactylus coqui TaxID=57060 RepID=A0A8J6FIN2_ELECQ|nr:hypothetical protein GDO78_004898 [Eleutherodactylus coqui]